ncbi:MAG: SIR2 family protein, partial [Methanosarcina vacuolata]|nr:SIR2 family protein [Methanosarcina vacuolata]
MSDAVRALAGSMVARKKSGRDPYILLIGAGASLSSECSSMISIVDDVLETYSKTEFNNWKKEIEDATLLDERYGKLLKKDIDGKKLILFFDIWSTRDHDTRYSILREHLWEGKIPSKGYNDLVDIIKQGYFNTIISTNLDHLIEKALEEKGLRRPDNFIVLVNGKDKPEEIIEQIESSRVSLKILKLHGTLESPRSYAFTEEEIFDFTKEIKPKLVQIINKSIIIIGHSMQDRDINVLFEGEGKEIHFVNPSLPDPGSMIYKTLVVRRKGNIISGDDGDFDTFFQKLKLYLEEEAEDLENINSTYSIERFLKSIGYEHELRVPQSRYKNLSTLYVKPTEYDSICSKLEKDHVVFIIGEPHLGKTYTAIHILWEYYQKGYETLHIRHDQLITLLYANNSNSEKLLHDLISEKKGESLIIHFDDPFGETIERSSYDFAKD